MKPQEEALSYIELLSSRTCTPIQSWDIPKIFGSGKSGLVTDKNEINKRFFEEVEAIKVKLGNHISSLESKITKKINSFSKKLDRTHEANNEKRLKLLKKKQGLCIKQATKLQRQAEKFVRIASKISRDIRLREGKDSSIGSQIGQIVRENFWEFHKLVGSSLKLVTRSDVILTYKNSCHDADFRVNMGRYMVTLGLDRHTLHVSGYKNNIRVEGFQHPHINYTGSVCWGSASGVVQQKLPQGELADVLRLLAAVLCSYNDNAPYIDLESFADRAAERSKE
jgi:hypothetical protein